MKDGLDDLEQRFEGRGFAFRCYPKGTCEPLRYQCGIIETTSVIVPASIATGHRAVEMQTECFRLIACAGTVSELAKKLSRLPPRPYRELLDA